jgi:type IV secretory pathway VirB10-like protein
VDFYEVGVYLVIIIVACICVFGIMWLLMKSMQPKRPKGRRRVALSAAAVGKTPRQIPQESAETVKEKKNVKNKKEKKKKEKKSKAPKIREDRLLELKELPDNRLLPQGEAAASSKGTQQDEQQKTSQEPQEKAAVDAKDNDQAEAGADDQSNAEMTLPDLPSMDTLTSEEEAPKEEELDLMSVFQAEDAEDSSTSDLAANLFDVDVQNIEKLGSEVSEFLGGMRSK